MKAALLALSLLGQQPVPVSDHVPVIDVQALCSDVSADDKASGLARDASACVSDEKAAQQQLESIWLTVPAGPRDTCESLAMAGGGQSYVDLLTCLQMAGWTSPGAPDATQLKGAGKNRNAKK
jgi:hypothetical protein